MISQVSFLWFIYVFMVGYLVGWTSRNSDRNHANNWWAVKAIWVVMGVLTIFVIGYSVAKYFYK